MTRLYVDAREDLRIDGNRARRHARQAWRQTSKALDVCLWLLRDLVLCFLRLLVFLVAWFDETLRDGPQRNRRRSGALVVRMPEAHFLRGKAVRE